MTFEQAKTIIEFFGFTMLLLPMILIGILEIQLRLKK